MREDAFRQRQLGPSDPSEPGAGESANQGRLEVPAACNQSRAEAPDRPLGNLEAQPQKKDC